MSATGQNKFQKKSSYIFFDTALAIGYRSVSFIMARGDAKHE
jgi:hypothetical protein